MTIGDFLVKTTSNLLWTILIVVILSIIVINRADKE